MPLVELQYRIVPPPNSDLQSPYPSNVSPTSGEDNGAEKTAMYQFQKSGSHKVNFEVPYSYAFFEEKSIDGCPKHLKVYLLGFDRCETLFAKYADNVECIDFFGCFNNPEICFRICAQLKKLKDVRFNISGNRILDDTPSPRKVTSWNGLKSPHVSSLSVLVNSTNVGNRSFGCQEMIRNYVELLLDYSKDQFSSIRKLNLELPDTDTILNLTRNLLRSASFNKPNILITMDESIKVTYDAKRELQSPLQPTQSHPSRPSKRKKSTSPDSSSKKDGSSPTPNNVQKKSSTSSSSSGNGNKTQQSSQQASSGNPGVTNNTYSYDHSTAERLLRESAAQLDRKNALIAKRRESREQASQNEKQGDPKRSRTDAFKGKAEALSPVPCNIAEACSPLSDILSPPSEPALPQTGAPESEKRLTEEPAGTTRLGEPQPPISARDSRTSNCSNVSTEQNAANPKNFETDQMGTKSVREIDVRTDPNWESVRSRRQQDAPMTTSPGRNHRPPHTTTRRDEQYSIEPVYSDQRPYKHHSRGRGRGGGPGHTFRGGPPNMSRGRGGGSGFHPGYNDNRRNEYPT